MNIKPYFRLVGVCLIAMFGLLLFAILLLPVDGHAAPDLSPLSGLTAQITPTNSIVYLPLALRGYSLTSAPQLASPANGAVLDTLIPVLIFDTGTQPAGTAACLAFSTTPHPTTCASTYFLDYYGSHVEDVVSSNLEPGTVYYWRAGLIYDSDYDHPNWSAEWSFTAGAAGGLILPAPVLQSPADNSVISTSYVTLTWQSVPGAIEYAVTLHGLDAGRWAGFEGLVNPQVVINISDFVGYGYGNNFEWYVKVRNDYAWSDFSAKWKFTYSAP